MCGKNRFGILDSHWLCMWFSFGTAAAFRDMMKWKHFIMVNVVCQCIVQFLAFVVVSCTADHNLWCVVILRGQECTLLHSGHIKFSTDHVFTFIYLKFLLSTQLCLCLSKDLFRLSVKFCATAGFANACLSCCQKFHSKNIWGKQIVKLLIE